MPPVYAILSFFSYRYYTNYTYWEFGTVAYESLVVSNLFPSWIVGQALTARVCLLPPPSWQRSCFCCSNLSASPTRSSVRS